VTVLEESRPAVDDEGTTKPESGRAGKRRGFGVAVWVAIALVVVVGVVAWRMRPPGSRVPAALHTPMPVSSAIEQGWGIRFTAVSVLADGGLVEVRYPRGRRDELHEESPDLDRRGHGGQGGVSFGDVPLRSCIRPHRPALLDHLRERERCLEASHTRHDPYG
jgi:hypothetical protein